MKRFIAICITFVLLLSLPVHASENKYEIYANKLANVGVFKGTGSGYELDRAPSRIEGIIMLIRLLGKEDDALAATSNESVFSDVPDWAVKYTNYAYNNGLTKGIADGLFGSDMSMNADAYYTYLLRALGYDDSKGDFSWNTAVDFAYSLGMIKADYYERLKEEDFKRDHVAKSSYDTLYENVHDSSNSLLDVLVSTGDIDPIVAADLVLESVTISALDKVAEYVTITNNGFESVDITGWTIVSIKGHQTFVFPPTTILLPGQSMKLTSGKDVGKGDFDMANTTIWNNSDQDDAELLNANGTSVDYWIDSKHN